MIVHFAPRELVKSFLLSREGCTSKALHARKYHVYVVYFFLLNAIIERPMNSI